MVQKGDTKYKDNLLEPDLYQMGFYIHEYTSPGFAGVKKGYAILPTADEEIKTKNHVISSMVQKIQNYLQELLQ